MSRSQRSHRRCRGRGGDDGRRTGDREGREGPLTLELAGAASACREGPARSSRAEGESRTAHAPRRAPPAPLANMVRASPRATAKLELVGVGYRAAAQGKKLNLPLGFSHPVRTRSRTASRSRRRRQTEILIKGADKQRVGQVAAEIRGYRPPEPYKGKGVRYASEQRHRKTARRSKRAQHGKQDVACAAASRAPHDPRTRRAPPVRAPHGAAHLRAGLAPDANTRWPRRLRWRRTWSRA